MITPLTELGAIIIMPPARSPGQGPWGHEILSAFAKRSMKIKPVQKILSVNSIPLHRGGSQSVRSAVRGGFRLAMLFLATLFLATTVGGSQADSESLKKIRIGALQFGTVNWELDVIKRLGLAEKEGVDMEVVPLASKNAAAVALQGGAADVIVTDWFWVSRQRAEGRDYSFAPYSVIAGGLMVRPDSQISNIEDLHGRSIGVAGGPVDKSWLLLRAYSKQITNDDLLGLVEPVYGAPPLLNRLVEKGEFPAVLTFWHYQARLKAKGLKKIIDISDVLEQLGIAPGVPIVGWVFSEKWARANEDALRGFLRASAAAKKILAESDDEWLGLESLIKPGDNATLAALRDGYREGIPRHFGIEEVTASKNLYHILSEIGGSKLVGDSKELSPGTFWAGAIE